jgi:hypothetical protein
MGKGLEHHARVDQGAAAEAVGHQGAHIRAHAEIEQPVELAARVGRLVAAEAHVARQLVGIPGKGAGKVFLAALQHADVDRPAIGVARAGELRGGDRAAVAAADDEDVDGRAARSRRFGPRRGDGMHQVLETQRQPGTFPLCARRRTVFVAALPNHAVPP